MRVSLTDDGEEKSLDDTTAAIAFRAVRELLLNVTKHARSRAASLSLRRAGDHLEIVVEDAGVGFEAEEVDARAGGGGFGLFSVSEQIHRLGGEVKISSVKGRGTSARLRIPLRCATSLEKDANEVMP